MRNASSARVTEWVLVGAAAIETVLIAALALLVTGAGRGGDGRGVVATFERLNARLLLPFEVVPWAFGAFGAGQDVARQVAAILFYGAIVLALAGASSWFERRRATY